MSNIEDFLGGSSNVVSPTTKTLIIKNGAGETLSAGDIAGYDDNDIIKRKSWGLESSFNTNVNFISSVMIDSTHVLISYEDDNNNQYGTSIIGTISGTNITWGSENVFNSGSTVYISSIMIDSTHVLVSYRDNGNNDYGTSIIGTISGTDITFGTASVFNSAITNYTSSIMIDSTHVLISYEDGSNNGYGTSIIGTISGTSITWGSESVFNSGNTYEISSVMIDSTHVLISYRDNDNSSYGTSIIGTINGNSITWGSVSVFNSGYTQYISSVKIDNTHVLISYRDNGNSSYGTSIIGTINGNSITWGSASVFNSANTAYISSVMLDLNHICIVYDDINTTTNGKAIIGTISGNNIVWNNGSIFNSNQSTYYTNVSMLDSTRVCVTYIDNNGSGPGIAIILNLYSMAYGILGVVNKDATSGSDVELIVEGTYDGFSGLTQKAKYYIDSNGNLTIDITPLSLGMALSSTQIYLNSDDFFLSKIKRNEII